MRGLFITFEGNDGSGKSSALQLVKEKLIEKGYDVVYTREPGGSKIAEKIRQLILDTDNVGMDDVTEALLYASSRREHIEKTIKPALAKGKIVLCDRFVDSSLAYQGYARGIGIDKVYDINKYAIGDTLPDLTILVCVHPEIGLNRIKKNRQDLDRLELEKLDFHQRVYEGYLEVANRFPDRIIKIDGEKPQQEVLEDVEKVLFDYIKRVL